MWREDAPLEAIAAEAWTSVADMEAALAAFARADQHELSLYRLRRALGEGHAFEKEIVLRYHEALVLSGNVAAALELRGGEIWARHFPAKGEMDAGAVQMIAGQIDGHAARLARTLEAFPFAFASFLAGLKRHQGASYRSLAGVARPLFEHREFAEPRDRTALMLAVEGFRGYGDDLRREMLVELFQRCDHETLCRFFQSVLPANGALLRAFANDLLEDPQGLRCLSDAAICRLLILGYGLFDEALYERILAQVRHLPPAEGGKQARQARASARIARAFESGAARSDATAPATGAPLRIAVCVSGQMRGYAAAFQTWKHLGLDGHQVKYFIHTWEDTGWRFPDPMSGNGVDRIFKFAPFAEAYRQAGFRYGLAAMKKAYPNFFARLEVSSTLGEADLRAVYGADAVVAIESHRRPEFENDANNQLKMFYKIQEAHRLMLQDGGDYDLVIRIRPDRAFRAGTAAPDWAGMAEACRRQRVLFFNHLAVTKTLYAGDQFAVGSPEAMGCYANTLGLQTQAIRENWFGFPKRLRSHCSLAHALLFQGVRRRPLEHIHAVEAVPAAAYGRGELRAMLSADLPAGPASEMDRLLWNALAGAAPR